MPDIRHAITINAQPDRIHPLIGTGLGFAKWWAADVTGHPAKGIFDLGFFNRATVYRLQLLPAGNPPQTEWLCQTGPEWQNTRIVFQMSESKGQTLLRFSHAGWQAETDYFVACNTTWGELMFRLKAAAEGKNPGPLFTKSGLAY